MQFYAISVSRCCRSRQCRKSGGTETGQKSALPLSIFCVFINRESRRSRIQGDTPGGRHHPGAAQRFILQVE